MRRLLVLLLPVVVLLGCSRAEEGVGADSYELLRIEGNVAGPQGERSYRVDGERVTIVVRDGRGRVLQEDSRSLSTTERSRASEQVRRALAVGGDLVCLDAVEYRLAVDQPSGRPLEAGAAVCFPEEVAPFEELERLLRGDG